jgi:hypothetical protein
LEGNYTGSASDKASIEAHGIKAKTIDNDLFQSDAVCAASAEEYLADFKDAKDYAAFKAPLNAYPIELGDTLKVYMRLTEDSPSGSIYGRILYGQNKYATVGVTVALRGIVRDCKGNDNDADYLLELE